MKERCYCGYKHIMFTHHLKKLNSDFHPFYIIIIIMFILLNMIKKKILKNALSLV